MPKKLFVAPVNRPNDQPEQIFIRVSWHTDSPNRDRRLVRLGEVSAHLGDAPVPDLTREEMQQITLAAKLETIRVFQRRVKARKAAEKAALPKLLPATIRALRIIKDRGRDKPLSPAHFAQKLWPPDDPRFELGWARVSKAGPYGSTHGAGMWRAGGAFLGKLKRQGLIYQHYVDDFTRVFWLTSAGEARLKAGEVG